MLSGNPNKQEWQVELDQLTCLPGEVFDKNEAWETLHSRLSVKKNRKKTRAYWMAAALAVGFVLVFLFNWKAAVAPEKNEAVTKLEAKKQNRFEARSTEKQSKEIAQQVLSTQQPAYASVAAQAKHHHPKPVTKKEAATYTDTLMKVALESVIEDKPLVESIAIQPAKRKLRVVHINEVGLAEDNKDRFVRTERSSIGTKMLSGGSFPNTNFNSSSDDIFKIKLSPNN